MPEPSSLTDIARTLYGLERYDSERRRIYRVQDTRHGVWMFRLWRRPDPDGSLLQAARLLEWLARQDYPAPSVRRTTDGQLLGVVDDWGITVLTYVDGTLLGTDPGDLRALAQMLGRLHAL